MTTIAHKDGILACDSAWTNARDCFATLLNKITVFPKTGAVIGEAGDNDSRAVRELLKNVKRVEDLPTAAALANTRVDYSALMVFPDGRVAEISIDHDEKKGWIAGAWEVNRGFAAVGSGGEMAIGFMGAGKTAVEAVEFCCEWDPNTKGPIHSVNVKEISQTKTKTPASSHP